MLYFKNIRQFIKVARCKKRRIRVDGTDGENTQENMNNHTYYTGSWSCPLLCINLTIHCLFTF